MFLGLKKFGRGFWWFCCRFFERLLGFIRVLIKLINVVVNFIQLAWFAAIWLLVIFALTVYYALGLVTLLDGVDEVTTAPDAQEGPAPSGGLQNAVHHV